MNAPSAVSAAYWMGDWRKGRAGAHDIGAPLEIEEHYRQRSMLKRDVPPEVTHARCRSTARPCPRRSRPMT